MTVDQIARTKPFRWSANPSMETKVLLLIKNEFLQDVLGKQIHSKIWTSIEERIGDNQIKARSIMTWYRALRKQYLHYCNNPENQAPRHLELLQSIIGGEKPVAADTKVTLRASDPESYDAIADLPDVNLDNFKFRPVLKKPKKKSQFSLQLEPNHVDEIEDIDSVNADKSKTGSSPTIRSKCSNDGVRKSRKKRSDPNLMPYKSIRNKVLDYEELTEMETDKVQNLATTENDKAFDIKGIEDGHQRDPSNTKLSGHNQFIDFKDPIKSTPLITSKNFAYFFEKTKNNPTPILKENFKRPENPRNLQFDGIDLEAASAFRTPQVEHEIVTPIQIQPRKAKLSECFLCGSKIKLSSQNNHYSTCLDACFDLNSNSHFNNDRFQSILKNFNSCIYCKTDLTSKITKLKLGHLKNCASLDELGLAPLVNHIELLSESAGETAKFVKPIVKNAFDFLKPPLQLKKAKKTPKTAFSKISLLPETLEIFKSKTEDYLNSRPIIMPVVAGPQFTDSCFSEIGPTTSLWDMGRGKGDVIKRVPQVLQFQPSSQDRPLEELSPAKRDLLHIGGEELDQHSGIVKKIGIEGVSEIEVLSDIDGSAADFAVPPEQDHSMIFVEEISTKEQHPKFNARYSQIDLDNIRIEYQNEIDSERIATTSKIIELKNKFKSFAQIKNLECKSKIEYLSEKGFIEHPIVDLDCEYGQGMNMDTIKQLSPRFKYLPTTQSQKIEIESPLQVHKSLFRQKYDNGVAQKRKAILNSENVFAFRYSPKKAQLDVSSMVTAEYLPFAREIGTNTDAISLSEIALSPIQIEAEPVLRVSFDKDVRISDVDLRDEESDDPTQDFLNSADISKSVVLINTPNPETSNLQHLLTPGVDQFSANVSNLIFDADEEGSLETIEPNIRNQITDLMTEDDLFSDIDQHEMQEDGQSNRCSDLGLSQDLLGTSCSRDLMEAVFLNDRNQSQEGFNEPLIVDEPSSTCDRINFDPATEFSGCQNSEDDDIFSLNELPQTQVDATQLPKCSQKVSVLAQLQRKMPDYKSMTLAELKKIGENHNLKPLSKSFLVKRLSKIWDAHATENYVEMLPEAAKMQIKDISEIIMESIKANHELYARILRYEEMADLIVVTDLDADYTRSVGLLPDQLSERELKFLSLRLPDIQSRSHLYLYCRNYLIKMFTENCCEYVDIRRNFAPEIQAIFDANPEVLIAAEEFLDLHRYINYGLIELPEIDDWKFSTPKKIVIIGANLTGIVAAREIHNLFSKNRIKTDITVLERCPRIGGSSITFPMSSTFEEKEQPCVELGPKKFFSIITFDLDRGRTANIIKQLGLETSNIIKYDQSTFKLYDVDGSIINGSMIEAAQELLIGVLSSTMTSDISEIEEILRSHKLFPSLHDTHIRILHWLLAELEMDIDLIDDQTPDRRINLPGGSSQIIHGLAYGLEEGDNPFRIITKKEVTNLDFQNDDYCLLFCGPKDVFKADVVVLAAPESTLIETIKLNPPLPIPTIKNNCDFYAEMPRNKIILVFPRIFWPLEVEKFGLLSIEASADDRGEYFSIENLFKSTGIPCLQINCSGLSSLELEGKDDQTILDEIMDRLSIMFPFECPLSYPIEYLITRLPMKKSSVPIVINVNPRMITCNTHKFDEDFESAIDRGMVLATNTAKFLFQNM